MLDPTLFQIFGAVAGIGGIACGIMLVLFREVIRKNIFPTLTPDHAYKVIRLILILTWSIAVLGIGAWAYGVHNPQAGVVGPEPNHGETGTATHTVEAPNPAPSTAAEKAQELLAGVMESAKKSRPRWPLCHKSYDVSIMTSTALSSELNRLREQAYSAFRDSDWDKAEGLFKVLVDSLKQSSSRSALMQAEGDLGIVSFHCGHYDKARKWFRDALSMGLEPNSSVTTLVRYAYVCSILGDESEAIDALDQAEKQCLQTSDIAKSKGNVLTGRGSLYLLNHRYQEGANMLLEADRITPAEQLPPKNQVMGLFWRAVAFHLLGKYDEARNVYLKAESIAKSNNVLSVDDTKLLTQFIEALNTSRSIGWDGRTSTLVDSHMTEKEASIMKNQTQPNTVVMYKGAVASFGQQGGQTAAVIYNGVKPRRLSGKELGSRLRGFQLTNTMGGRIWTDGSAEAAGLAVEMLKATKGTMWRFDLGVKVADPVFFAGGPLVIETNRPPISETDEGMDAANYLKEQLKALGIKALVSGSQKDFPVNFLKIKICGQS